MTYNICMCVCVCVCVCTVCKVWVREVDHLSSGVGTFSNFVAKKLHHFGDKELSVAKTTRM